MARPGTFERSGQNSLRPISVAVRSSSVPERSIPFVRAGHQNSAGEPVPLVDRWPGATRVAVAVGLAVASWMIFVISIGVVEGILKTLALRA